MKGDIYLFIVPALTSIDECLISACHSWWVVTPDPVPMVFVDAKWHISTHYHTNTTDEHNGVADTRLIFTEEAGAE